MSKTRRRYWDSACFIAWLSDETERVPLLKPVIREAEAGNLQIVTSALTLAEVLYSPDRTLPTEERAEVIKAFFQHEWIVIVNLDRDLASLASPAISRGC